MVSLLLTFVLLSAESESFGQMRTIPTIPTTVLNSKAVSYDDPVDSCNEPLGMQSGKIRENQVHPGSLFNNQHIYGANNARLNKTSFPPGYLSAEDTCDTQGTFSITFDTKTFVTGIATQGYGDESMAEWVKSYSLYWQQDKSSSLVPILHKLRGNSDATTIVYNRIPEPKEVKSLYLIPLECNNGKSGLRLEFYGCVIQKTYVLWVRRKGKFHKQLFETRTPEFKHLENDFTTKLPPDMPKFLFFNVHGCRPGSIIVQLEVGAAEAEAESLIKMAKKKLLDNDSLLGLDDDYFYVQDLKGTKTCKPPKITLNLSNQIHKPTVEMRSKEFIVKSEIKIQHGIDCNLSGSLEWQWSLSRLPEGEDYFEPRRVLQTKATKGILTISQHTLQYGTYYIEQRVGWPNSSFFNSQYGFLMIGRSPLKGSIVGPPVVARGYSDVLTIDASGSYDPDMIPHSSKGMIFQWSCQRVNDQPNQPAIGCFGTSLVELTQQQGPVLKLPVNRLKPNTYNISVTAWKDIRNVTMNLIVKVDQIATMNLHITCKQNCGQYEPKQDIVLQAKCHGLICQESPFYTWKVKEKKVYNGNESWEYVSVVNTTSTTKFDISRITIPKGILKIGVKYMLEIYATSKTGVAVSNFTLNSNEAPTGGRCFVEPSLGEAFTTFFNFTCEGWTDEEPPLTYKFHFINPSGVEVLLQYSNKRYVSTKLPVGFANNDYKIDIKVSIADSDGVGRDVVVAVKVNPTVVENSTIYHYTVGKKSRLSVLLKNNNIKQATSLANEVLSILSSNAVRNMSSSDKIKIKDNMITHMASVNVTDMKKLIQVSSVVAGATENRTELSKSSKEKSMEVLESMADVFSQLPVDMKKESNRMVSEASTNLIHGMGNVLETFSFSAAETVDKQDRQEKQDHFMKNKTGPTKGKEENKEAIHKVLNLIEKVSDTLLARKSPGDEAIIVKTNKIEMLAQRENPEDMGKKAIVALGGGVQFPSSDALFGNNNQSHVDTQMLILKNNPYTWDKSAKSVKSSVLTVDLKSASGKKLKVEGLSEEIELIIKDSQKHPPATIRSFSKPSVNGSMRYHTTNITGVDRVMHINIKPEDNRKLEVYVAYRVRPTVQSYIFKTVVPDVSKCENNSYVCSSSFVVAVPANLTKKEGLYFIGIKQPYDREVKSRTRRSCSESGRQKRSVVCVEFKDPPTTPPPTPQTVIPLYNPTTDVNYTISIAIKSCLYWSETKQIWTNYGCRVSPKFVNGSLVCLCNHLSSFGGDFFVAPNPIDFDKVWFAFQNIGQSKNYVVLATLCTIFGFYFVILIFARKADKNDELKVTRPIPVSQINDDSHCYEITVYTGMWRRCGTTSNVAIKLCGEDGETGTISMSYSAMCDKQLFGRGSINVFILSVDTPLGDLNHIRIWHDNSGDHPAWFLRQVVVRDIQNDTKWYFVCNNWLALEKDDGKIDRVLYVSSDKEINGFRNKFCSRAVSGIGDGHLWISVVTRPPTSSFSRVQRATCCLCVLLTAMVTNAMFYQFGEEAKDSFKIGPLFVSLKQIIIGIQSSIIVVPVNLLIVFLFKNAKPKDDNETIQNNLNETHASKKKSGLPHSCAYVAWILVISASLTSAAFTLFYSMMWGREISNQWLTSILVSFSQDIILIQPIKVLIVATLLAFIIKKAPEDETSEENLTEKNKTSKEYSKVAGEIKEPQSPKNEDLEKFRQYRVRVLIMARTLIELFFYLMFVWMLMVICYGSRDVGRYWMTHAVKDMLMKFDKVKNADGFWNWLSNYTVPGLYSADWYNGQPFEYKEGFVSNKAGYLVGMPRLRQLRTVPDECPIKYLYPSFSSTLNKCIPPYSFRGESKSKYNQPGWFPLTDNETNFYTEFELHKICPRPWRYRTANQLHSLPYQGESSLYGGGGYVADLGYTSRSAHRVLHNLKANSWINENTRAVFLEVLIFEPSSSFFSAVTYLFEKPAVGGGSTYVSVKTMSLYGARSHGLQSLYAICELTIILIVIYFVIAELIKFYRQRLGYFKRAWNWMELTQILSSIATVVLSIFRRYHATNLVEKVHHNPFKTSSFHYVVMWTEIENSLMAVLIFIITVKLLRILKFNQHISTLGKSMAKCGKKIASYSAVFFVAFLAFSQVAILVFGSSVEAYSSVVQVFRSQFSIIIGGDADYRSIVDANSILGPIYFFSFMTAMATILINMFLAILNESYREVHVFKDIVPEEHKMLMVFLDYANLRIKKGISTFRDKKLFPKSSKYEVNEHLLIYEKEKEQKYTPIDEPARVEKHFDEDTEDMILASVKGCFQALKYDLRNIMSSRKKTYKVQKVFKRNNKSRSDLAKCQCQAVKLNIKSLSPSFLSIADDVFKKEHKKDDEKLLLKTDKDIEGNDMTDSESESESELYLENSLFFGQQKKYLDRETNL